MEFDIKFSMCMWYNSEIPKLVTERFEYKKLTELLGEEENNSLSLS